MPHAIPIHDFQREQREVIAAWRSHHRVAQEDVLAFGKETQPNYYLANTYYLAKDNGTHTYDAELEAVVRPFVLEMNLTAAGKTFHLRAISWPSSEHYYQAYKLAFVCLHLGISPDVINRHINIMLGLPPMLSGHYDNPTKNSVFGYVRRVDPYRPNVELAATDKRAINDLVRDKVYNAFFTQGYSYQAMLYANVTKFAQNPALQRRFLYYSNGQPRLVPPTVLEVTRDRHFGTGLDAKFLGDNLQGRIFHDVFKRLQASSAAAAPAAPAVAPPSAHQRALATLSNSYGATNVSIVPDAKTYGDYVVKVSFNDPAREKTFARFAGKGTITPCGYVIMGADRSKIVFNKLSIGQHGAYSIPMFTALVQEAQNLIWKKSMQVGGALALLGAFTGGSAWFACAAAGAVVGVVGTRLAAESCGPRR